MQIPYSRGQLYGAIQITLVVNQPPADQAAGQVVFISGRQSGGMGIESR